MNVQADPREAVEAVLEPGEKIIWCARPDRGARARRRRRLPSPLLVLASLLGGSWLVLSLGGSSPLDLLRGVGPWVAVAFILPIVVYLGILTLVRAMGDAVSDDVLESRVYAITDRRLLVVDPGGVQSYRREEVGRPRWRRRPSGAYDVLFPREWPKGRAILKVFTGLDDLIGFYTVAEAGRVQSLIQEWRKDV